MKKSRSQSSGRASSSGRSSAPKSTKKTPSAKSRTASPASSKKSVSAKTSSTGRPSSATGSRSASASTKKGTTATGRSVSAKSAPRAASKASSNGRTTASKTTIKKSATPSRSSSNGRATSTARARAKQLSPREGLTEVLKDGLKDIYYAEKQLVKALKKLSKAATNQELKQAFTTHMDQTSGQVEKLEAAFQALDMKVAGKKCPAMDGLIEESNEHIEEMDKGSALDAALIVGAQKVEHYEIAAYGSLRTFAKMLGYPECEKIFNEILDQESQTDELLTKVAQTVNREALGEEEGSNRNNGNGSSTRMSGEEVEVGEMEEEQM